MANKHNITATSQKRADSIPSIKLKIVLLSVERTAVCDLAVTPDPGLSGSPRLKSISSQRPEKSLYSAIDTINLFTEPSRVVGVAKFQNLENAENSSQNLTDQQKLTESKQKEERHHGLR